MLRHYSNLINDNVVCTAFIQAWKDSNPSVSDGHEEGGFILQNIEGNLSVIRWENGEQNSIIVPPHNNCRISDNDIIASFHTHPNIGSNFIQEPSLTDIRAVRDDPNLKGEFYIGEFVISKDIIYLVMPSGKVQEIESTQNVLNEIQES